VERWSLFSAIQLPYHNIYFSHIKLRHFSDLVPSQWSKQEKRNLHNCIVLSSVSRNPSPPGFVCHNIHAYHIIRVLYFEQDHALWSSTFNSSLVVLVKNPKKKKRIITAPGASQDQQNCQSPQTTSNQTTSWIPTSFCKTLLQISKLAHK
jgi:hypothetical protein